MHLNSGSTQLKLLSSRIKRQLLLRLCGIGMGCNLSCSAFAAAVTTDLPQRSLGLGLSSFYLEQADRHREQRFRFELLYLETISSHLRIENHFAWAPDRRQHSQSVDVLDNVYEYSSALRFNLPYLFRYGLSAGPLLRLEETILSVQADASTRKTFHQFSLGWQAALTVDYAFDQDWELSFFLAYQGRPRDAKSDILFGVMALGNGRLP